MKTRSIHMIAGCFLGLLGLMALGVSIAEGQEGRDDRTSRLRSDRHTLPCSIKHLAGNVYSYDANYDRRFREELEKFLTENQNLRVINIEVLEYESVSTYETGHGGHYYVEHPVIYVMTEEKE